MPDDWEPPDSVQVPDHLAWAWRAWRRLNADRPYAAGGMGPPIALGIPWRDVVAWADRYAHDADELDTYIQAMDGVYLQWRAAQIKAALPNGRRAGVPA